MIDPSQFVPSHVDRPSFTLGFEAGMFWIRLAVEDEFSVVMRRESCDAIERMCADVARFVSFCDDDDDGWVQVHVKRRHLELVK